MLKDFDMPVAVPIVSTAVSVDELRAQVREKRYFTWSFQDEPDLLVDFSETLDVTLFEEKIIADVPCRLAFGFTWFSVQEVQACSVKVRNGDRERKICYLAKGFTKNAITLKNKIEAAKAEYERAVRALRQAEESSTP